MKICLGLLIIDYDIKERIKQELNNNTTTIKLGPFNIENSFEQSDFNQVKNVLNGMDTKMAELLRGSRVNVFSKKATHDNKLTAEQISALIKLKSVDAKDQVISIIKNLDNGFRVSYNLPKVCNKICKITREQLLHGKVTNKKNKQNIDLSNKFIMIRPNVSNASFRISMRDKSGGDWTLLSTLNIPKLDSETGMFNVNKYLTDIKIVHNNIPTVSITENNSQQSISDN